MSSVSITKGTSYAPYTSQTVTATSYVMDAVGFNNSSAGMTGMDLQLNVTSVTPTAGGTLAVYMIPAVDGTNYANPPGGSAVLPPQSYLVGTYAFTGGATTVIDFLNMPMALPYPVKLLLLNNCSATVVINSSVAQPTTITIA